jgi:exosortase
LIWGKVKGHNIWYKFANAIKIGIIIFLVGFIYYPIFTWMWQRWFAADSYYSHGPLIPIVSGVLIWLKRREIAKTLTQSSKLGLGLILAGLILHIISAFTNVYFASAYSFLIILIGIIAYLYGNKVLLIIIFPLCFLFFMIPAPMALIESTTLKMKLLTAQTSVYIIQLLGVPAIREGSSVYMSNTNVVVDDPCSGLKSLISLSALSTLYAYLVKSPYIKKLILFLVIIPLAIIANVIRTTSILLIANRYGNEIITNKYIHEGFGLMIFIIAFAGLFLTGRLLGCQLVQKDS